MDNSTENQALSAKEMQDASEMGNNASNDEAPPSNTFLHNKKRLVESSSEFAENKKSRTENVEQNVQDENRNPLTEKELLLALKNQIEYYFSDDNLRRDYFFNTKLTENQENWLAVKYILSCRKIMKLNATQENIEEALVTSDLDTKLDEKNNLWIRRTSPVPSLDPDVVSNRKNDFSKNQQCKKAQGCPTSVQNIHQLGCFLKIQNIPKDVNWLPVKKALQEKLKETKLKHVSKVTPNGEAYAVCRPFPNDVEFFSELKTIDVNGQTVAVGLVHDLNLVSEILANHVPKGLVRDRVKDLQKLKASIASTPLSLGGTRFENVEHLRKCYKELLDTSPLGECLKPQAFTVIRAILNYHPNAAKKLHQIKSIKVDLRQDVPSTPDSKPTKCFFIVREDDSCEDVSMVKCITEMMKNPPRAHDTEEKKDVQVKADTEDTATSIV
ncbi:uncharacterized protein LOC128883404 [Hylaeus volcanicus]|uniref:uncharacterized protein LOC128883404 n=1 Tax=Hylaeus volcanicus TaxID=313075 RepID=UPI0023B7C5CB|nr:uncharacterized protein LOC128883404 [Hylaeus volcanicus]